MYSGDAAASYADFLPHRRAEALDQVLNGVHVLAALYGMSLPYKLLPIAMLRTDVLQASQTGQASPWDHRLHGRKAQKQAV